MAQSGFAAQIKRLKIDDLNRLFIDFITRWAADPKDTQQGDYAAAVAIELERRGKQVPTDQVRAEIDILGDLALERLEILRRMAGL